MKIKVCGMRDAGNIEAIAALKPDYMGFIFYEASKRFIDELPLSALNGLKAYKTGVFVDARFDSMVENIMKYDLDAVQLHGSESPGICEALRDKKAVSITDATVVIRGGREVKKLSSQTQKTITPAKDVLVIKAFGVDEFFDFEMLKPYAGVVDYFLFDTKTEQHGGSGKTFDWGMLDKYNLDVPFFLSGGISLDNLEQIKQIKHPMLYAVDLNSKFELEPGLKDVQKLAQAFKILNN